MSGYTFIPYADAKKLIYGSTPYALLDVREADEYAAGHVLTAANTPLSRLEILVFDILPSRTIPIVLMDGGGDDSRAARAAMILADMGFASLRVLKGGACFWRESGGTLVSGLFCFPKGFAEAMEHARQTPLIRPEDVMDRLAGGDDIIIVEVRFPGELQALTLENAVNAPGCEALHCFTDIAPDPKSTIVVTCAARARGIIWAQAMLDSGVPNPVFALMGGAMNWAKVGGMLTAASPAVSRASDRAREAAIRRTEVLKKKFALSFISISELKKWQESDFPLYIYDVRTEAEYEITHLEGSRSVPGGDLILKVEQYAAMRHARMVLVDDDEARASVTASILLQMGLDSVHILKGGLATISPKYLTSGRRRADAVKASGEPITAETLATELESGLPPLVIDIGPDMRYQAGHIPSSLWASRPHLDRIRDARSGARKIVLTSDDESHAQYAANDAVILWPGASVRYLKGGTPAWEASGLPLEKGMGEALSASVASPPQPKDAPKAKADAMEAYFDWNNTLAEKIREDGSTTFRWP